MPEIWPEIWRAGGTSTGATREQARAVEAEGWDGQMFMDSQCLSADPYAQMGVWACSTQRIRLSTGVTNPLTRNLAVTANAAATVQAISGGRAVLGIGRGDSALAWLGHAPVSLKRFGQAIGHLQTLLSGGEVPFADFGPAGDAPSIHGLPLGVRPEGVRLNWLPEGLPKVPLDVAATGPKVIAMSALAAERVTFSVGADPERMRWAIGEARKARAEAGLTDEGISYGAQIAVICHPDEATAMATALHMVPPLARFQIMQRRAGQGQAGPADAAASENLGRIREGYDMTEHGNIASKQRIVGGTLSPDFVKRFAVVGSPEHCLERLLALMALGLERIVVVGPGFYPAEWGEAADLFAKEVLPGLKAG
ncbi:LLM class flavin-dependent oxidoreductase [Novosphingobium beihaiensis]|uniref:LLM class flavin-dependent oxidoreductase n=1 Tax=Novosphingobium beihaiensis TaxID=2930389 RepID=A0ABT0BVZ1_9SPHN|nr:LLM class flavin-dependent oxidoreductase [Novosphingobium beihaiensis]MCJ2188971.1 LLM class flavin-dependent oxidoreductase [Novosphingobium beihaiensis]